MRFISITKPGIIFGNIVTATGGFFLASQQHLNFSILAAVLIGMSFIIAAGCILNNYIDRDIDSLMERTKHRAFVLGHVSVKLALSYAILLGIIGLIVLFFFTNLLATIIACIGLFFYVVLYTMYLKRKSSLGTLIGAIAGAVPPMVGYCALTNRLDSGAWILFIILFLWQMPHFYAIALYRLSDYQAAAIPVLPVTKGVNHTKVQIILYIIAFTLAAMTPTFLGYTGFIYLSTAFCLGMIWLCVAIQNIRTENYKAWARKVFLFSLLVITLLSFVMLVKS